MIRMMFACLLVCAAVASAPRPAASDESFPFGSDLMLDAEPMRGSKRVPIIEIEENGSATIDLWCSSAHADATVGDDSITIVPGPPQESAACTSERADSDQSLLAALALVTKWRRQGEVIELTGPTTLRFRLMTN